MSEQFCRQCGTARLPASAFCGNCGSVVDDNLAKSESTSKSHPAPLMVVIGRILAVASALTLYSSAIAHAATKLACTLSDGSSTNCGGGPTHYTHISSALILLLASILAFALGRWPHKFQRARKALTIIIVACTVGGLSLAAFEIKWSSQGTPVGQMADYFLHSHIPQLTGRVEGLDSGGQQFVATMPARGDDIKRKCGAIASTVHSIENQHQSTVFENSRRLLSKCVNAMGAVRGPQQSGAAPSAEFLIDGRYFASRQSPSFKFRIIVELSPSRHKSHAVHYPSGYGWKLYLAPL